MAAWLGFHEMSVICTKTKNRLIHYNNCVLQMPNEWLLMGVKQAVKLVLKPSTLRLDM